MKARTFGENVKGVLAERRLTQAELAEAWGRSRSQVSDVLSSENLESATMEGVAEALGQLTGESYTVASLMSGTAPEGPMRYYSIGDGGRASVVETLMLRYLGAVPCGQPLELEPAELTVLPLPVSLLGKGITLDNTVVVRAEGESMTRGGILPGDLLLVRLDVEGKAGDAVLVNVSGGPAEGAMIKRKRFDEWGRAYLEALYPDEDPTKLYFSDGVTVTELGVVVNRLRFDASL